MNIKQLKRWEQTRTKGKIRFILLTGVIKIGFSTAIIILIIEKFRRPTDGLYIQSVLMLLIGHSIVGYILGLLLWTQNEREYLLRKDELTKPVK